MLSDLDVHLFPKIPLTNVQKSRTIRIIIPLQVTIELLTLIHPADFHPLPIHIFVLATV